MYLDTKARSRPLRKMAILNMAITIWTSTPQHHIHRQRGRQPQLTRHTQLHDVRALRRTCRDVNAFILPAPLLQAGSSIRMQSFPVLGQTQIINQFSITKLQYLHRHLQPYNYSTVSSTQPK